MSTRKFPLAGLPLTGDELMALWNEKKASLSPEAATALLNEVEAEKAAADAEETTEESVIPTEPEDQEAFGVAVYDGTKMASARFNELRESGLSFEDAMAKLAEDIAAYEQETADLRARRDVNPEQELLADMVAKVAEEDPAWLAKAAAEKLEELGYELVDADDAGDIEDENEGEGEETSGS